MKTTTFFQNAPERSILPAAGKKILVSVDFSDSSAEALRGAARMAKDEGASLTLMHVIEEEPSYRMLDVETRRNEIHQEHENRLRKLAQAELGRDIAVDFVVAEGSPAREIARVAAARHSSLIVMGRHQHHGLKRFFHGHTAEDVLNASGCPVVMLG